MSGLAQLAPELFVHDGEKRFLGFRLHRRMTVVRLPGQRLWVHSPNLPGAALLADLASLGPVAFVVAANRLHGHAVREFAAACPGAEVYAAPGLSERRPTIPVDHVLGPEAGPEWAEVLDQAQIEGTAFLAEVVFLHRPSRTLIVTDLVENLRPEHVSPWGRCVTTCFGLQGRVATAPEHSWYAVDAGALEASFARIRAWDFDRILPAHGSPIERDAKAVFRRVADRLVRRARWQGPLLGPILRGIARLA